MKYVIPAVLAFVVGFVLWQMQRDRMELSYELVESEFFPREEGIGRYFVIRIVNSGNRPIASTQLNITLSTGKIETARFSDPSLITQVRTDSAALAGMIPLLNPGEVFGITITSVGKNEISSPKIVARAPGASAVQKGQRSAPDYIYALLAGAIFATLTSVAFTLFTQYRDKTLRKSLANVSKLGDVSKQVESVKESVSQQIERQTEELQSQLRSQREETKKREEEFEQGKPSREQILFAMLNKAGLVHLIPLLIRSGEEISYWKAGLFLMHSFLVDEENRSRCIDAMKSVLSVSHMAPSSRGSNLYLLAKMEQFIGKTDDAVQHLEQCRKETPLMYEHLMAQDPAYDLERLREWLVSHLGEG